jgi:hypothetical protein
LTGKTWFTDEPKLSEMLEDPIVKLVMERDGVSEVTVRAVVQAAARRLESGEGSDRLVA